MKSIYDLTVNDIDGKPSPLNQFSGKALLIVNTASKCGFTPQYAGLEQLYNTYKDQGFVVLGFPCDQFGNQEPGDEGEIKSFCSLTYDVTFPMFSKIDVNGPNASPLFEILKDQSPGLLGIKAIKWNFTKFLIDRSGKVVDRFAPTTKPENLKADIEAVLAAQAS